MSGIDDISGIDVISGLIQPQRFMLSKAWYNLIGFSLNIECCIQISCLWNLIKILIFNVQNIIIDVIDQSCWYAIRAYQQLAIPSLWKIEDGSRYDYLSTYMRQRSYLGWIIRGSASICRWSPWILAVKPLKNCLDLWCRCSNAYHLFLMSSMCSQLSP